MLFRSGDPNKKRELGGHDSIAPMGPSRLRLSKPVIAAVEGFAVAGRMELALWADMRVVADDATFGIFCRRFGVPLIDLGTIRLPRLIGHSQAIDLILTGRPVGAHEALRMGLANRVVGRGEAGAHAIALAREIARFPQKCMRADRLSALRQSRVSTAAGGSAHRRNRIVAADLALLVGIARCHRLEVGARAEIAAGAGEHRDRRRCVGIEREKGIVEFARGRAVHGVPAMRSVDGNDGDGAVALDKDSISFRHGCAPCLLFWE